MSEESCLPYQENLAAYALGALDADMVSILESHLEDRQNRQSQLADYRSLTTGLLASYPAKDASSGLRRKLVARLPSHRSRYS